MRLDNRNGLTGIAGTAQNKNGSSNSPGAQFCSFICRNDSQLRSAGSQDFASDRQHAVAVPIRLDHSDALAALGSLTRNTDIGANRIQIDARTRPREGLPCISMSRAHDPSGPAPRPRGRRKRKISSPSE